jgi:hypothetical protein
LLEQVFVPEKEFGIEGEPVSRGGKDRLIEVLKVPKNRILGPSGLLGAIPVKQDGSKGRW